VSKSATIAIVALCLATAAAIIGGFAFYRDPSIECVKAGGTWVVKESLSNRDHCQKAQP